MKLKMILIMIIIVMKNVFIIIIMILKIIIYVQKMINVLKITINIYQQKNDVLKNAKMTMNINMSIKMFVMSVVQKVLNYQ